MDGNIARAPILELDPELGQNLTPGDFALARRVCTVPIASFPRGTWIPPGDLEPGTLGLLVVDGVLGRRTLVGGRYCLEPLGAGDVLSRGVGVEYSEAQVVTTWRVLIDASVAVLDRKFLQRATNWPEIPSALMDRAVQRTIGLSVRLAVSRRKLGSRIWLTLWQMGSRWGRVRRDGVALDLPLTHEAISELVAAERESVSRELERLMRWDLLRKDSDSGRWVLRGPGPAEIEMLRLMK
jgi:Crp-like helix-turn-helix domain